EAHLPHPVIVSSGNLDQGWSWLELDTAIRSLPPGPARISQRTYFDALTLLGVLMEHGDRKPEQQSLYCDGTVDTAAGDVRVGPRRSARGRGRGGPTPARHAVRASRCVGLLGGSGDHRRRRRDVRRRGPHISRVERQDESRRVAEETGVHEADRRRLPREPD